MTALGRTGLVEGVDYRGVKVWAVLSTIPDSPWCIVAKLDNDEALAVWHTEAGFILIPVAGEPKAFRSRSLLMTDTGPAGVRRTLVSNRSKSPTGDPTF